MRRHRRNYLSGLFFTSGNYGERSMADDFGFSRQYADTVSQGMMNDERIEKSHGQESSYSAYKEPDTFNQNIVNTPGKGQPNCL